MEQAGEKGRKVCVTGAGGYVASWLIKLLLANGYQVHGTVRDPSNERNSHLMKLDKASENLRLFKVELLDYDSVLAAIAGCQGVFHVASPVPATKVSNPEEEVIAPAVTGTLNVLNACSAVGVKRVVVVSSVAALAIKPQWPEGQVMDEGSWSDKEYCQITENWYCLSKTMAEAEALEYAEKHRLDVVTVCPSLVIGPMQQPTVNASSLFLITILRGIRESMEDRIHHIVDVRDLADALLLTYETTEASGRYICASHPIKAHDLVDMLKKMYPDNNDYRIKFTEPDFVYVLTSEKLKKLGWRCRPLEESLVDSVEFYKEAGHLEN
ncbi:hypothetical protein J5N97_006470 [Dioscorea zingiberensis]|uniref:NAD-dependent epimerase/dehydratase domain-containing protein n=1 Tax=Dioscorea zingiberensis TaxID=325984 RepID=A0A9D5HTC7_9LILI|nr:hypothetical protein J5N97_006470 [Dioscorea zingiberensis]